MHYFFFTEKELSPILPESYQEFSKAKNEANVEFETKFRFKDFVGFYLSYFGWDILDESSLSNSSFQICQAAAAQHASYPGR